MFSGYKGLIKPPPGTPINPLHPLSKGLVGYWLFNEGAGSRANDISGHGNHGTLENMSPNAQDSGWGGSKFGGGLQFDGVNDYVNCGSDESLDITEAITVEAWVKSNTVAGYHAIVAKDNASIGDGWWIYQIGDELGVEARYGASWDNTITTTDVFTVNQYAHVSFTFNKENTILYVNGVEIIREAHTDSIQSNNHTVRIGVDERGNVDLFNGSIDSVRIYNRALSAEEIKILYHDPFCNLLRVPVRYVPAAPEIIELTTSTSAPNVLMLRELASTIAATTSVSAADVDVLRELTSTIDATTLLSDIELLTEQLWELVTTIATVTSTSTPEMKVLRELEAIIEATTALSAIELMITMWLTSNPTITRLKSEGWFE
jgi:hypothetical protein